MVMTKEEIIKFRNNGFTSYLGIQITDLNDGYAKGEMPILDHHENPMHSVHGGCLFSLADTVAGTAAAAGGTFMSTISGDFHYLSPAVKVEKLIAVATEKKRGKKIAVYNIEIFNEQEELLAIGTFSFFNLDIPLNEIS